jgi:hypothetical protein
MVIDSRHVRRERHRQLALPRNMRRVFAISPTRMRREPLHGGSLRQRRQRTPFADHRLIFSISRRAPARTVPIPSCSVLPRKSCDLHEGRASPHDSPRRRLHCHDVMTPHLVGTIGRTSDARSSRRNHYAPRCASGVPPSAPGDLRVSLRRRGESSGLAIDEPAHSGHIPTSTQQIGRAIAEGP